MTIEESLIPDLCRKKWPIDGATPATWAELEEELGVDRVEFRSQMRRHKAKHTEDFRQAPPQVIETEGVRPDTALPDPEETYRRAVREWQNTAKLIEARQRQSIRFDHGPICIVEMADLHLGDPDVNYPRLREEAEIVADTPGMFLIGAGDWLSQLIVGRLKDERTGHRLSIPDEWALARLILSIVQEKLLVMVLGNHDNWLEMLVGVSYFQRELTQLAPHVLYDTDEALLTLTVEGWEIPVKVRHKWRGRSQWNVTHAIEKAAKFDNDFLIGVGAHDHPGGVTRAFNVAGSTGMAMMAGAYKVHGADGFARRQGFARPNNSTAVACVIDADTQSLTGFTNLEAASNYMRTMYDN